MANDVRNHVALLKEIARANQWMRRKHPLSISDAVAAAKERIQRIDPRFDVTVKLVDENPHFALQAKENISIQWSCGRSSTDTIRKMVDSIDRGYQIELSPGEVVFEGSAIFEQFGESGGTFWTSRSLPATCTVACESFEGVVIFSLVDIPGEFTGGKDEVTFNGSWPKSAIKLIFGPVRHNEDIHMRFTFCMHHWNRLRLCDLPYFDRTVDFVMSLKLSSCLTLTFSRDGNELVTLRKTINSPLLPAEFADDLVMMKKAREVAKRIGVNPHWDTTALYDEVFRSSVNWLHGLLFDGGTCNINPSLKMTMECRGWHFLDDEMATLDTPRAFRICGTISFDLLGVRIYASPLILDLSDCILQIADGVSTSPDTVHVHLLGTNETVVQLRPSVPLDQLELRIQE